MNDRIRECITCSIEFHCEYPSRREVERGDSAVVTKDEISSPAAEMEPNDSNTSPHSMQRMVSHQVSSLEQTQEMS